MSLKVVWLCTIAGFGWFAYFAVPSLWIAGLTLAQGNVPDWNIKDAANLGGFATFAAAMYFLHRESIKTFRDELSAERTIRTESINRMSDRMHENTQATQGLSQRLDALKS